MISRIYRAVVLSVACLSLAVVAGAQAPAASSAAPGGKVGIVNVRAAIASTAEGKQATTELQSQFAPRQTDLQNMNKQIEDLRQRLDTGRTTLSQDEQGRLQREGEKLTTQLNRKQQDYQDDVNSALGEVQDKIGRKLVDVLDRYARENGFSVVLDSSAQGSPIIYASNQIDVTQEIIKLYDQQYPVKASAAAPAKPAPKPAATNSGSQHP